MFVVVWYLSISLNPPPLHHEHWSGHVISSVSMERLIIPKQCTPVSVPMQRISPHRIIRNVPIFDDMIIVSETSY